MKKTATVLLVVLLVTAVFTACNPEHTHSYTEEITKEATCTEKGIKTFKCPCGDTKTEEIPALGHSYGEPEVTKIATCTAKGEKTSTCSRCGDTSKEEIPTAEHSWNDGEIKTAATCTEDGEKTFTCSVCQTTRTEAVSRTGHSFSSDWSHDDTNHWHAATCTHTTEKSDTAAHTWDGGKVKTEATESTEGVMTYTCTVCGMTKDVNTGKHVHTYSDDWTSNDSSHWHASTCGHDTKSGEAEHSWQETSRTNATCTEDGIVNYSCSVCGKTKSETLNKTGHTFSTEWTSDETSHWHAATCAHTTEKSDTAAHTWDGGKVKKEATESTEGVMTYTCTVCGTTKDVNTEKHVHTYSDEWTSNDSSHWHASTCGHDTKSEEAEHSWQETSRTNATCTEDGTVNSSCSVCGKTKSETLTKTGHTFSTDWTSDETSHWHAATCGDTTEKRDEAAHTIGTTTTTKEATCKETGIATGSCTTCGKEMTKVIEKTTTHSYTLTSTTPATEYSGAIDNYTCSVCGATKSEVQSGSQGTHTHTEDSSLTKTVTATCVDAGSVTTYCSCYVDDEGNIYEDDGNGTRKHYQINKVNTGIDSTNHKSMTTTSYAAAFTRGAMTISKCTACISPLTGTIENNAVSMAGTWTWTEDGGGTMVIDNYVSTSSTVSSFTESASGILTGTGTLTIPYNGQPYSLSITWSTGYKMAEPNVYFDCIDYASTVGGISGRIYFSEQDTVNNEITGFKLSNGTRIAMTMTKSK